jgi:hypothetical protein
LLFRAARTQRCAGEGELFFGLTEHGVILPQGCLACQRAALAVFARLRVGALARMGSGAGDRVSPGIVTVLIFIDDSLASKCHSYRTLAARNTLNNHLFEWRKTHAGDR